MKANYNNKISFLEKGFFFAFFGLLSLMFLSIFSNNDIRGVESNVIYTLQQILDDNTKLYLEPNALPYAITQYTPLYYVINDAALSFLGIKSTDFLVIRIVSRFVSVIFLLGSVVLFFKLATQHFKCPKAQGVLLSSLLVVFTFPWNSLSRPDVLVLFFDLCAVYLLIKYLNSSQIKLMLLLGVCAFFSFASKQNGVVLPVIIGMFLLYNYKWKAIIILISGFGLGLLLTYLLLIISHYDLTFLKANIVDGVKSDINFMQTLKGPYKYFLIYFGLLCIGFIYGIKYNIKAFVTNKYSISFFLLFTTVLLFIISSILALKVGSGINYYNEVILVMLLIFAKIIGNGETLVYTPKNRIITFLLIVGVQVSLLHYFYYSTKIAKGIYEEYISTDTSRGEVVDFLDDNLKQGYFFSDDRKINLAIYKQCILPQFEIHQATLGKKIYDHSDLKVNFNNGTIEYLILNSELRPVLNIDYSDKYHFQKKIGYFHIYKFKD